MMTDMGDAAQTITAVSPRATAPNRAMALPSTRPPSSDRPSPSFWPSSTVAPIDSPVTSEVTVCITWLPVDTADTSAGWPNWPTTIRSTAPYMACRNSASSTGSVKRSNGDRIGPWIKL